MSVSRLFTETTTFLAARMTNGFNFNVNNPIMNTTDYSKLMKLVCFKLHETQLHNRFFKHLEYTQYLVLVGGDCPLSNAKTQGRIQASSKPYVTNITCHIAVYFMLGSSKSKRQNITQ